MAEHTDVISVVINCTSGMARVGEPGPEELLAMTAAKVSQQQRLAEQGRQQYRRDALRRLRVRCTTDSFLTTKDLQDLLTVLDIREEG